MSESERRAFESMRKVLESIEWVRFDGEEPDFCPACGGLHPDTEEVEDEDFEIGHADDCPLVLALVAVKEPETSPDA